MKKYTSLKPASLAFFAFFWSILFAAQLITFPACYGYDGADISVGDEQAAEDSKASAGVMKIYAIDVGQGDSALVVFPDGSNMLIDCGPSAKNIKSLLSRLGIAKINRVILTHDDGDHTGGYNSLKSGGYIDSLTQRFDWSNTTPGDVFYDNAGATVTCVTSGGYIIGGAYVTPQGDNDECVGVIVSFRGFDYLTCGDIEYCCGYADVEEPLGQALKARGEQIDVYKVDHHGSRYGSNLNFLKNIMPEFAVIMVGDGNGYGHPTQETIDRLNNSAVHVQRIFQTETGAGGTADNVTVANGEVVITTDGATYSFTNEGPESNPFAYGPYNVDEYVTPEAPHLMVSEVAVSGAYLAPETHRWVELYLPPGASSVDVSGLYWVSKDHKGRLAKNGPLTMEPGDVAIVHMTGAADTVYIDESNDTGKGANNWWDVSTHLDGNYWYTTDDCFMISKEDSLTPNPINIFDAVVWSNLDNSASASAVTAGNFLIKGFHWGDPVSGSGSFSSTADSAGVGSISYGYAQRITTLDTDSKADWQISQTNSQGTPPPTPTPVQTPTPLPMVDLTLNTSSPSAGETFTVSAVIQPITGRPFDAYAVIVGKAGVFSIQPGNRLRRGVIPIVQDVNSLPASYSGVLLNMRVPQGVAGDYRVIAGLVDTGGKVRGPSSAFAGDTENFTVK